MHASLQALLKGVIDYAGLFPPAKLALETAFRNYVRYQESPDRWLLGRFVCPAGQLPHLVMLFRHGESSAHAVPLSILGRGGDDGAAFFANLTEDLAYIADFCSRNHHAHVDNFEVRIPPHLLASSSHEQWQFLQDVFAALRAQQLAFPVSFEASLAGDWQQALPVFLNTLQQDTAAWGLKMRCGGLVTEAFPSAMQIAQVLHACRLRRVPLKFTAGLHHPFRQEASPGSEGSAEAPVLMHGFLNIFVAGILANTRKISTEEMFAIIADEDPSSFQFDDAGLRWREFGASLEEIGRARRLIASFGSCSFEEPLAELQKI